MKRKRLALAVAMAACLASGCSYLAIQRLTIINDQALNQRAPLPEVPNYARDVVYATVEGEDLLLDVTWPETAGPFPIVVNIHGGAFFMGSKGIDEALCRYLTRRGYVVVNVNYRLAPQHRFPAAVNDCLGAVIWAKAHAADYRGDPKRVAVMGGSAGGNLAAMVALAWDDPDFTPTVTAPGLDARVQAAIPIFAVWDLAIMSHPGAKRPNPYIGGTVDDSRELFEKASPIFYLDRPQVPPMLLVCGDKDGLFPQSQQADQILTDRGVPHDFFISKGKGHGFTNWNWQPEAQEAYQIIAEWLNYTF